MEAGRGSSRVRRNGRLGQPGQSPRRLIERLVLLYLPVFGKELDLSLCGLRQDKKADDTRATLAGVSPLPYGTVPALGSLPSVALSSETAPRRYGKCRRPPSDKSTPAREDPSLRHNIFMDPEAPDGPRESPIGAWATPRAAITRRLRRCVTGRGRLPSGSSRIRRIRRDRRIGLRAQLRQPSKPPNHRNRKFGGAREGVLTVRFI